MLLVFFFVGFLGLDGDESEGRGGKPEKLLVRDGSMLCCAGGAQDEAFSRPK